MLSRSPRRRALIAVTVGAVAVTSLSIGAFASSSHSAEAILGAPPGGFAAYHPVKVTQNTATFAPHNKRVKYHGEKLEFKQTYIDRKAAEPTLGVDRKGGVFTVAAAFDAIPGSPPKNEPKTLVMRSTDGGRSFQVKQPTIAGENAHPASTDPYIYVDPDYGRVFDIDLTGLNGSLLSYSDDQGESYTTVPLTSAFGANDHQTLVAGVAPQGAPFQPTDPKFPKILYYCVNQVLVGSCARSFDGGKTFIQGNQTGYEAFNPGYIAAVDDAHNDGICGSLHGHAVTDRLGTLFIPRGYCAQPYIAISKDEATTFTDVKVSDGVGASGQQSAVAVDKQGHLYYVWFDNLHSLPYLSISRDGGMHWGTPMMIAPPGVHEVNFPSIDVGDAGKVVVTFPGTTFGSGDHPSTDSKRPWNFYVAVSTNALDDNPLFVSNIANPVADPIARGDCNDRCGRMYDFLDVVSAPMDQGRIWATEVDTCTALLECNKRPLPGNHDDVIADETTGHIYGVSADMQGVIVREVSGPALRGKAKWIAHDTKSHS